MKLLNKFKDYLVKDDAKKYGGEILRLEKEANLSEAQRIYFHDQLPKDFSIKVKLMPVVFTLKQAIKQFFLIRILKKNRENNLKEFRKILEIVKSEEIWKIRAYVEYKYKKIIL